MLSNVLRREKENATKTFSTDDKHFVEKQCVANVRERERGKDNANRVEWIIARGNRRKSEPIALSISWNTNKHSQIICVCVCARVCFVYCYTLITKRHSRYSHRMLNLHTPFFPLITLCRSISKRLICFLHHILFVSILRMKFALISLLDQFSKANRRAECTFIVVSNVKCLCIYLILWRFNHLKCTDLSHLYTFAVSLGCIISQTVDALSLPLSLHC